MSAWIVTLLISGSTFLLGWLLMQQWVSKQRPFTGTRLEAVFASLTLGLIIMGWLAFVLAELGSFSIFTLGLLWAGLSLFLVLRRRHGSHGQFVFTPPPAKQIFAFLPGWVEWAALGLWLVAAVYLFGRPHQFVVGGADAGVYVNLGAEIAKNGSILIQDDFLANLPASLYPAFLRPQNNAIAPYYILPAFFVIGEPIGEITPQFYHLHPVWQAVAYSLGGQSSGVQAELLMSGFWALLSALAVYLSVRRIVGWETALLALAGLSLNALQVWFARYPTTETFTQFLLWAGFWSLGVWLENPEERPYWGLLAGLALGQSFLVRIDMLFVLPILGLFGLWLWVRAGWKQDYNWFFLPLLLLILHSLVHALWQSRPYFFELFGFALRLLRVNWYIPVGAGIIGIVLLIGLGRYRRQFIRLGRYQRQFLMSLIAVFIVWALYGWFVRPYFGQTTFWNDPYSEGAIPQLNHENLIRLGWYLSPVGIWLGVAGIGLLIWQVNRETAVMLATSLLICLIYLTNIRANPHQIYAMRRYVPVVMPLFIIGGACFLGWLAAHKKIWSSSVALILTLVWLGGFAWLARGFIRQVDYQGILPQIDQLASQFEPGAVLIFNDAAPISQGDIIGTPLRFLKGYDVLTLRDPDALDDQEFENLLRQWQRQDHSVYWIKVPNGYDWPLSERPLTAVGQYDITATVLENKYERRPWLLETWHYQGEITLVNPVAE
jgi:4-amino-4-deoxy-L-arabinose transferase-like glycosyltransferase